MNDQKKPVNAALPVDDITRAAVANALVEHTYEEQQRKLREWLIYEAPPALYAKVVAERMRLLKEQEANRKQMPWPLKAVFFVAGFLLLYRVAADLGIFQ